MTAKLVWPTGSLPSSQRRTSTGAAPAGTKTAPPTPTRSTGIARLIKQKEPSNGTTRLSRFWSPSAAAPSSIGHPTLARSVCSPLQRGLALHVIGSLCRRGRQAGEDCSSVCPVHHGTVLHEVVAWKAVTASHPIA
eukprot:scaffold1675_cov361-Prasinococcus_capsulatus_cf.AAC.4